MRALFSVRTMSMLAVAAALLCPGVLVSDAFAQSYPDRRITFVVPYPPGGATDVTARLLATKLSEAWKQTVVVENKSGGGGVVGNDFVAKAAPDGYTVLIAITQIIQAPNLGAKLPYDVFKDLAPVTQAAISTIVFTVPDQQPEKSFKEFVTAAKGNPGKLSVRLVRQRHHVASLRRALEEERRHRHDPRAVSRLGTADERSDRRSGQRRLCRPDDGEPADERRQDQGAGRRRREAQPARAEHSDARRNSAFRASRRRAGSACSCRRGRRRTSSRSSTTSSRKIIKSPEGADKIKAVSLVPVGDGADAFAAVLRKDFERWGNVARTAGVKAE